MKTKLILLTLISVIFSFATNAQTSWQISGNSNITNNNFIGTTNKTALKLRTNNIVRMTISGAGNVGIGTTSPKSKFDVAGTISGFDSYFGNRFPISAGTSGASYSSVGYGLTFTDTTARYRYRIDNDFSSMLSFRGGGFDFNTAPIGSAGNIISYSTVMAILQNGNVGIGTLAPANKLVVMGNANSNSLAYISGDVNVASVVSIENTHNGIIADGLYITAGSNTNWGARIESFQRPDGTQIGYILQNSVSSVQYATSSDKRLKNIIGASQKGLSDLMKIRIYDYTFKSDKDKKVITGFMAQELYEIFPQAVSKPRDNNEPAEKNPWMVDYGSVTPLIIKSVQEQQQTIDQLQKSNEKQKEEISLLKERLAKLETALANVIAMKDESKVADVSFNSSLKKE